MASDLWKKYGGFAAAALAGAAICAAVILYESAYLSINRSNVFRIASDGCFAAAVALLGVGMLVWIAGFGGFDGLTYTGYLLVRKFTPRKERFESRLSYLEYRRVKRGKKKNPKCLLAAGAFFLVLAAVFALIYG